MSKQKPTPKQPSSFKPGDKAKEEGNRCFKAQRWKEALNYYSKAILWGSTAMDKVYSNRSITFLKLHKYQEALADSERCISLNSSWGKGYFRKGEALAGLGRIEKALQAFCNGLSRDPDYMMIVRIIELAKDSKAVALRNTQLQSVDTPHWTKCIEHFVKDKVWGAVRFIFLHEELLPDASLNEIAASVPLVPFIQANTNNDELLHSLIAHGAELNRVWIDEENPDSSAVTPLQAAHKVGSQSLAVTLIQKGADPASISPTAPPLHVAASWAVNSSKMTFLTFLLEHCEWQQWVTDASSGDTPLHVVCNKQYSKSNGEVLMTLLEHGIDPTLKNRRNKLPEDDLINKDKRRKLISNHLKRLKESSQGKGKKDKKKDTTSDTRMRVQSASQPDEFMKESVSVDSKHPESYFPSGSKQAARYEKQALRDQISQLLSEMTKTSHLDWVLDRKMQERIKRLTDFDDSVFSEATPQKSFDSTVNAVSGKKAETYLSEVPTFTRFDSIAQRAVMAATPEANEDKLSQCVWEVRCTADVWKLLHNRKKNHGMAEVVVEKIRMLANGEWRHDLCREIKGTPTGLVLFEANVSRDVRIVWERAKSFSPRLSAIDKEDIDSSSVGSRRHVYTEVVRIWDIVFKHDELSRRIRRIAQCHKKGEAAVNIRLLEEVSSEEQANFRSGSQHEHVPKKYLLKKDETDVKKLESLVPPANPQEKDFNVVKFYSVTESMVTSAIATQVALEVDFPFDVNPEEWDIIYRSCPTSTLLLGRSGTGKTTCCLYRMWVIFKKYWSTTSVDCPWWRQMQYSSDSSNKPDMLVQADGVEPQLMSHESKMGFAEHGDIENSRKMTRLHDDVTDCDLIPCTVLLPKAMRESVPQDRKCYLSEAPRAFEHEVAATIPHAKTNGQPPRVSTEATCEQSNDVSATDVTFVHLQQVFVTKNGVLCDRMRKNFLNLCRGDAVAQQHLSYENKLLPYRLTDVLPLQFPLFLTSRQWLLLLDGSLKRPFFERLNNGALKQKVNTWGDIDSLLDAVPLLEEDASDAEDGQDDSNGEEEMEDVTRLLNDAIAPTRGTDCNITEVTYSYFETYMWSNVRKASEEKDRCTYHPSLVWTEIKSFIKGSLEALHSENGYLSSDEYCRFGRKQAPNFEGNREEIYAMFLRYEKLKRSRRAYDECDLVCYLYRQLEERQNLGWAVNQFYVDETQDFTQAEIALFLRCCQDPNAVFLTGDTAQGIMRGVSFRFKDIRSLFYHASQANPSYGKISVPKMLQLTENYRSHTGILELANRVVILMEHFFPETFDILPKDQGIFPGPKPSLLMVTEYEELALMLRGNRRRSSPIEFGARQVILVRSEDVIDRMPEELTVGLVMTVFEAKGLEFDDVLLYNFFTDSKVRARVSR